jgi:phage antirepressor YoqD-like protein
MKTNVFNYNGQNITFQLGNGDVMVNPNEMASPFGKHPKDWLRTRTAQEFINALADVRKCQATDLVTVINGVGTWYHEDVALEFARWLSPGFAIWCNDRIKELLRHGITATEPTLDNIINNPEFGIKLLTELKLEREQKALMQAEIDTKYKPRSEFVDRVFIVDSLLTMSQVAKSLGLDFGRNTLFKKLREKGVLFKNTNEPKQEYVDRGYFQVKEKMFKLPDGTEKIKLQTYVTQKGLGYIAKLFEIIQVPVNKTKFLTQ